MDLVLLLILFVQHLQHKYSFNPYFNGSSTSTTSASCCCLEVSACFNPYFNGSSTSTRGWCRRNSSFKCVSILILMDLVLLQVLKGKYLLKKFKSFNPYFNGSSTSTFNIKRLPTVRNF